MVLIYMLLDINIEGYPNGIQYATYWLNGDRFILGEGEITDIHVKDGTVYATGTDESWQAVYWVDGVKNCFTGKRDICSFNICP